MALTPFFFIYSSLLPLLPLGCLFYFILQAIIVIKGKFYDLSHMDNNININSKHISFCAFKTWELRFVIVCSFIDFMNSIVATLAFVIPLRKILKLTKTPDREITNAMKWDVALTFTATISSAISLCISPMTGGWMWCFCLVDPFINSSCCFFMMGINREFVAKCNCNSDAESVRNTKMMELSIQSEQNNVTNLSTPTTHTVTSTTNPASITKYCPDILQ
eukprot:UN13705